MKIKKITFAFVVAAVVTIGLLAGNHSFASQGAGAKALEGSWKVRLTPSAPQAQFDELMTFSAGGGIVESNNYPFFQLGLTAGIGQGTWSYAGRQSFPFTFIKFLYTPTGQAAGTLKVTGVIIYSPSDDTWSGPATVAICDTTANNCNTIDVTNGQATRIVAGQ
jgi:hypothetical protein